MLPRSRRLIRTVLTVTVGLWVSLAGCASYGPVRLVAVPDLESVCGTWGGTVYLPGSERNDVTVTIRADGSYDVENVKHLGVSRGRGHIVINYGHLIIVGENGRGTGTVLRSSAGNVVLTVDMTLSDNSHLAAQLSRTR